MGHDEKDEKIGGLSSYKSEFGTNNSNYGFKSEESKPFIRFDLGQIPNDIYDKSLNKTSSMFSAGTDNLLYETKVKQSLEAFGARTAIYSGKAAFMGIAGKKIENFAETEAGKLSEKWFEKKLLATTSKSPLISHLDLGWNLAKDLVVNRDVNHAISDTYDEYLETTAQRRILNPLYKLAGGEKVEAWVGQKSVDLVNYTVGKFGSKGAAASNVYEEVIDYGEKAREERLAKEAAKKAAAAAAKTAKKAGKSPGGTEPTEHGADVNEHGGNGNSGNEHGGGSENVDVKVKEPKIKIKPEQPGSGTAVGENGEIIETGAKVTANGAKAESLVGRTFKALKTFGAAIAEHPVGKVAGKILKVGGPIADVAGAAFMTVGGMQEISETNEQLNNTKGKTKEQIEELRSKRGEGYVKETVGAAALIGTGGGVAMVALGLSNPVGWTLLAGAGIYYVGDALTEHFTGKSLSRTIGDAGRSIGNTVSGWFGGGDDDKKSSNEPIKRVVLTKHAGGNSQEQHHAPDYLGYDANHITAAGKAALEHKTKYTYTAHIEGAQDTLNKKLHLHLDVDGKFGAKTAEAMLAHGLSDEVLKIMGADKSKLAEIQNAAKHGDQKYFIEHQKHDKDFAKHSYTGIQELIAKVDPHREADHNKQQIDNLLKNPHYAFHTDSIHGKDSIIQGLTKVQINEHNQHNDGGFHPSDAKNLNQKFAQEFFNKGNRPQKT